MIGASPAHGLRPLILAVLVAPAILAVGSSTAVGQRAELPPGPRTADQAVRIALERNYDVAIAGADHGAAVGRARQALSGILPSLTGAATYIHDNSTGQVLTAGNVPVSGDSKGDTRNLDLVLDQSIFSWASIQSLKSARSSARASSDLARATNLNVALEVRTQFYELLKAIKLREVRDEAVTLSEDQLRRADTMFELGSVARNDVLQARVNLQQARLEQIRLRNLVEVERGQLAQLMGLPADTPLEISEEILDVGAAEIDSTVVVREALAARPDVGAARHVVRSSAAGLGAARAGRYPELFGRVNVFWTESDITEDDDFTEFESDGWSAVAGVAFNIFDGMITEGQVKTARSLLSADRSRLQELESTVSLEVKEAILGVREARQSIASATEGEGLAEENLSLAQQRYEVGSGTILELNEAQVSLILARSALVDSQSALQVALARLDRARGTVVP
jgi:outer membrane protein TolC